jgi:Flp pilus assembly protein TadD
MATIPAPQPQWPCRARFRVAAALRVALIGSIVAWTAPVAADDLAAIQKLIRKGETTQAIEQLDAHLRTAPDDPQARFLKGVALADSGRGDDAIAVFTKLTEDHPELPEPYNNLAVLYAQRGLYERSRQALEMAIQAHPSYAIAYENLGDLYVKLASQAYDQAARLDARNKSAPRKLALARDLLAPPAKAPAKAAPATEDPKQ